ncbi:MAG: protein kinase, partial [Myxococcales bacterium]|nr:protein kinase [Myxococcales bacterium]
MTNIVPIAGHGTGGRLGRYVLKHEVATGGMATVYLAQLEGARGFDRWFAIKVIHRHLSRDRKFVNMFLDEARVTSRLHHQNVCSIIEFGEDVAPHIVMEYLHGETLASCIRNGWKNKNLPIWLGARVVSDAARGLHAAHNLVDDEGNPLNLVHRDVSP